MIFEGGALSFGKVCKLLIFSRRAEIDDEDLKTQQMCLPCPLPISSTPILGDHESNM